MEQSQELAPIIPDRSVNEYGQDVSKNFCNTLNDDYDHSDPSLEYVLENVLSEETIDSNSQDCMKLKDRYNTLILNTCKCGMDNCSSSCVHGGTYVFNNAFKELVLNSENFSDLLYECSERCMCRVERCLNRLVQHGPRKYLKIVVSRKYKSKGVITTRDIPLGAFICEYAGELLTYAEALRRMNQNIKEQRMNYVLCLKESQFTNGTEDEEDCGEKFLTIVDPARKGNIGRYLNHSCYPNCQIFSVRVDSPIPKIAIFSKRFISAGEELCFHYNEGNLDATSISKNNTPCLCGHDNCEKFLPNVKL